MDVVIKSTKIFLEDLKQFSAEDKEIIERSIDEYLSLLSSNELFNLKNIRRIRGLIVNFNQSLYSLKLNRKIRVFLTIDKDPIFEQVIVTLFRVFNRGDFDKIVQSINASLTQNYLMATEEIEVEEMVEDNKYATN